MVAVIPQYVGSANGGRTGRRLLQRLQLLGRHLPPLLRDGLLQHDQGQQQAKHLHLEGLGVVGDALAGAAHSVPGLATGRRVDLVETEHVLGEGQHFLLLLPLGAVAHVVDAREHAV